MYQVYVRSFADSSGDGVGDLAGVLEHLDHLEWLGVDGLWLGPIYPSPMVDGGYDVADTMAVDPRFGDLEDFDRLVHEAHRRGLRIIGDLVPNHVSDRHPWFLEALEGGPGHPARDRFHFQPGPALPNDWPSHFGGPAWTATPDGQWYLHFYAPEQPDLNWDHPDVIELWDQTLRFWLERGMDGFRIDSAPLLVKPPVDHHLGDARLNDGRLATTPWHHLGDRDEIHTLYRSWRSCADAYGTDRLLVAELDLADSQRANRYLAPDELHLALDFSLVGAHEDPPPVPLDARWLASVTQRALDRASAGVPMSWTLENHDRVRAVTRWGSPARAAALAAFVAGLGGVLWIYQGQELALEQVEVHVDDPQVRRGLPSRDGSRLPMPWSAEPAAGFTTATPWAPVPPSWPEQSVDVQRRDPTSWLWWYRSLLTARNELCFAPDPILDLSRLATGQLAYRRQLGDGRELLVVINCADTDAALDPRTNRTRAAFLRSDRRDPAAPLAPGACAWLWS